MRGGIPLYTQIKDLDKGARLPYNSSVVGSQKNIQSTRLQRYTAIIRFRLSLSVNHD
ncbi:hypothetical protein GCWU000324_00422 [Kingella oralis ATCC 51147]|uniref:Uncharacterized protein n=1 Tax=Kingella oralis ATCC 51147 TaxID=629741 RepID=C4GHT4_9NEIS|nr:hypothetical protein GCWU000324_00422 [Kingella oralis ATCC 51147]